MDCQWMGRRDVLIVNPTTSNQVDPESSESEKRLKKWYSQNPSETVIATGFIVSIPDNMPTILKRNGSDNSASIMGALLRARQVTIWTDVDGVYSADPRKVSKAVILTLSYQEAWEMGNRLLLISVLKEEFNIGLRVLGIIGSWNMLLSDWSSIWPVDSLIFHYTGIDWLKWRELLKEKGEVADLNKFTQHVHGNHFFPNTALVDCTADSHVASCYHDWLCKGIHNHSKQKSKFWALDQLKLRALQRKSYTHYFYEATVGAGVPIISTLRGLFETKDKILRIEGIFSEVVVEAKEAGYTEPDPGDDLSGTDVARRVIILATESGLKLELSDLPVCTSAKEFMKQLPQFDQELAKETQEAEDAGEVSFV
ncbi:hypothetical protein Pint_07611 [Pistacia integerrima]|uniref:Uncharacterized protein n=1 Tax=Pistacia integerrima TaxID=434235 RepID=A0ACC0XV86_9ROSI|nr:hypothetical protein Pint_07611 [Pistacia integerrima]